MRRLYTSSDFRDLGISRSAIRWGAANGRWRKIEDGIYGEGGEEPSGIDTARAAVLAAGGVATGCFAGSSLRLDGVDFRGLDAAVSPSGNGRRRGFRRREIAAERITTVAGIRCTGPLQTLVDLAAQLDDLRWEQALECALRRQWTSVEEVAQASKGTRGAARVRRVLALRPPGAPPTESLLETLMVQLIRTVPELPEPTRQYVVLDSYGAFVARVDLCWPALGLFIELDGQHHEGQPVYDASRETAAVAATGWLCGRFTWHEVVRVPRPTARRLAALIEQARRRPVVS